MSRRKIKSGSTSVTVPVLVQDTSSATGGGLGSLAFNTSGLAAKYRREGDATWTTITLATATVGTWASGGVVSDGGPVTGTYEFGVPNAVLAAGKTWAEVAIYGAANMLPVLLEFELDTIDYQASGGTLLTQLADGVTHGGSTAMLRLGSSSTTPAFYVTNTRLSGSPAVKFEATGTAGIGLYATGGAYGGNFTCSNDGPGISSSGSGSGSGFLMQGGTTGHGWQIIAGSTSGNVLDMTLTSGRYVTQAAEDEFATRAWAAAGRTITGGTITTYTGNTPQTGDAFARIGATGSGLTSLAPSSTALSTAVWTNTKAGFLDAAVSSVSTGGVSAATIAAAVLDEALSGHATAGTLGKAVADVLAAVDTEVAAIKAKTDQLTFTSPNKVDAALQTAADVAAAVCQKLAAVVLRRTMANVEADASGDSPSLSSLYGFVQQAQKSAVAGSTLTVKKTDGTTLGTKTLTTDPAAEPVTGVS